MLYLRRKGSREELPLSPVGPAQSALPSLRAFMHPGGGGVGSVKKNLDLWSPNQHRAHAAAAKALPTASRQKQQMGRLVLCAPNISPSRGARACILFPKIASQKDLSRDATTLLIRSSEPCFA